MKTTMKKTLAAGCILLVLCAGYSCAKKTETPAETCRTCIARDNTEGAPVDNEEVCSDEAEQNFRNANEGFAVTCE